MRLSLEKIIGLLFILYKEKYTLQGENIWARLRGILSSKNRKLNTQKVGEASVFTGDLQKYFDFGKKLREKYYVSE